MIFDDEFVDKSPDDGPEVRGQNRHQPPGGGRHRERFGAPARDGGEESRGEIPGRVDGVAAVEAETHADVQNGETDVERN